MMMRMRAIGQRSDVYHLPRIRSEVDGIIIYSRVFTACDRVGVPVHKPIPHRYADCMACIAVLFSEGIVYD